ncbi:MAG: DNA-3-methyladenine glycosylase 2 family protein [Lachnospiraceae bacterium]|nr:DNA-3-methyladenine glycosylase 2 family protein [Lachnospiraceae bacterium]
MKVTDFNLQQTLECGQCFNFEKIDEQEYVVIAFGKVLHITQHAPKSGELTGTSELELDADEEDIKNIWIPYFDLDRDYDEIKSDIEQAEPRLSSAISRYSGLRILNQEFTETLLSFIISQNKNIPQIKKIVRAICEGFGGSGAEVNGVYYRTFPDKKQLETMTEEDFRELKTGFRAPYLVNAVKTGLDGDILRKMSYEDAKAQLTGIKGVGDKVANCVLLFSLGFRSAFPVDVWIKRIMEEMYFGCDTDKKKIEAFAMDRFGKWGGYAQQYLFMHAREK